MAPQFKPARAASRAEHLSVYLYRVAIARMGDGRLALGLISTSLRGGAHARLFEVSSVDVFAQHCVGGSARGRVWASNGANNGNAEYGGQAGSTTTSSGVAGRDGVGGQAGANTNSAGGGNGGLATHDDGGPASPRTEEGPNREVMPEPDSMPPIHPIIRSSMTREVLTLLAGMTVHPVLRRQLEFANSTPTARSPFA